MVYIAIRDQIVGFHDSRHATIVHDSRRATQFREMHIGISSSIYCEEEGFVIFFSPLQG